LLDKSNKQLLETSKHIEQLKTDIEEIQRKSYKANEVCIKKKAELRDQDILIEDLNARLGDMRTIKEWRSELLADFISKGVKKERDALSLELNRYNKASHFISQLPSMQQLDMVINTAHALRNDYDIKKQTRDALEKEAKQTTVHLRKLKEDFSSLNQSKNTLIAQYEHLNALVENIFTVRPNLSVCPTCGTRFSDTQMLMAKIRENIANLRNAEGTLPEMFRSIPVLEEKFKEIQQKISSLDEMIQKIYNTLKEHEEQIQAWYQTADKLKQTLSTLQFPGIDGHNKIELRTFFSYAMSIDLNEYRQDLQRKINTLEARLSEQWHGLQKESYLEREPEIIKKLENMPELNNALGDAELLAIRIEEVEQKINKLIETKDRNKRELDGWLVQAESLKGQTEIKKTKLNELRIQKSEQEDKIKERKNLLSSSNEINSFFLKPLSILNLEDLQKKIISVSAQIEGFEGSLVVLLQSLKQHKECEKRKTEITDQRKENQKKLIFIKQTKSRIESVTPLETRLRNEWQQYNTYINDLFLKLQTPPDFGEIKLHGDNLDFDLRVVSRVAGEDKPANVLSSGQRAALAITIFWTMNLYGAYSPPLMLMDEPIQQIDDINSLNFLDTLRWIADSGKRQIIISTANSRIAGLIRRKFSYLDENFSELLLERHQGLPVIKLRDHTGTVINEQEIAERV
jgi:DNA repair exonuclease SbcCD ATPase subunit